MHLLLIRFIILVLVILISLAIVLFLIRLVVVLVILRSFETIVIVKVAQLVRLGLVSHVLERSYHALIIHNSLALDTTNNKNKTKEKKRKTKRRKLTSFNVVAHVTTTLLLPGSKQGNTTSLSALLISSFFTALTLLRISLLQSAGKPRTTLRT